VGQVPRLELWKDGETADTVGNEPKQTWDLTRSVEAGGLAIDTTRLAGEGILILKYDSQVCLIGSNEAAGEGVEGAKPVSDEGVPVGGVVLQAHIERWAGELASMAHFSINMAKYGESDDEEEEDDDDDTDTEDNEENSD